ncbi:MAG: hypothetical protein L3J39_08690 [Verrucomicrobiales bacterium]|nr:hypothetical protein [Verrucomicrobiales bacterium]
MIERIEGVGFFVIGWRLTFSNGQTMICYNCGDDARILLAPPLRIISSLAVDFVTIFQKAKDWRGFLDAVKNAEVSDSFLTLPERKQRAELRDPFAKA